MEKISGVRKYKLDLILILVLIILQFFTFSNTFHPEFARGNDQEFHVYHIWYLKDSIVNHGTLPSWSSDYYGGKPFLGLYQPGAYYLMLPISLLTSLPQKALIYDLFIANLIAIVGLYLLSLFIFKKRTHAFVAALIFTFLPYRLDLLKNPFTQYVSMMFVPFVFLCYERFFKKKQIWYLAVLGLLLGLTILMHHAVGAVLFGAIVLFALFDYFAKNKKEVKKIVPFLIAALIIGAVFLVPASKIQDSLHFEVLKEAKSGAHTEEKMRPLSYSNILNKKNNNNEYLGVLGIIALLVGLVSIKNKRKEKYLYLNILVLIFGLHLLFFIPGTIKETLQWASRFYGVIAFTLCIGMTEGFSVIAQKLTQLIKDKNILSVTKENKKTIMVILLLILTALLIIDYSAFKPAKENIEIPPNVMRFYEEVAKDPNYYRIDDQSISPFGFTPTLHRHGILNGAPMQEASKNHFFFWSNSWQLLKTPAGQRNFARLYGYLSIRFMVTQNPANITFFEEKECRLGYCIYENLAFQPQVRIVPGVLTVNDKEPNDMVQVLNILSSYEVPLDQIAFVNTFKDIGVKPNETMIQSEAVVEVLEKKPGYFKLDIRNVKNPAFIVIAESYNPSWEAKQDGKQLEVYKGIPYSLVIGVEGDGIVEVKFPHPHNRTMWFYLSLLIIIILIFVIVKDVKKWKHQ